MSKFRKKIFKELNSEFILPTHSYSILQAEYIPPVGGKILFEKSDDQISWSNLDLTDFTTYNTDSSFNSNGYSYTNINFTYFKVTTIEAGTSNGSLDVSLLDNTSERVDATNNLLRDVKGSLGYGLDLRLGRIHDSSYNFLHVACIGRFDNRDSNYSQIIDNESSAVKYLDYPVTDVSINIVSDSTDDVFPTGTGSRMILVKGYDMSGNELIEPVQLNGTTPVTLNNKYFRINTMILLAKGSGSNEPFNNTSMIYAYDSSKTSSDYLCVLRSEIGLSKCGNYYYPSGSTFYPSHILHSTDSRNNRALKLLIQLRTISTTGFGPWICIAELMMPQDASHVVLPSAPGFPAGDIGGEMRLVGRLDGGTSGNIESQVGYHGVLAINI